MRVFNGHQLLALGQMSGSTAVTTSALPLHHLLGYSIQFNVASNPGSNSYVTGTFKLQACNDPATGNFTNPQSNLTHWTDITGATQTIIVSGSSTVIFNAADAMYSWVRGVYTNAANSGSFSAYASGKGPT